MVDYFESGMMAHTPAWHRKGNVLNTWPGSFAEARKHADIEWDVVTEEVFTRENSHIEGWQALTRSDNNNVLTIQPSSYAVISNTEFGNIIEYILENCSNNLKYETLISIHGGKQIIATMFLDEPITLPNDPSITLPYLVCISRHDGQGGLKIGPSGVRVVCANTQQMAEREMDRNGFVFTIRHTSNWAEKANQAKAAVESAFGKFAAFEEMAHGLSIASVDASFVERFLDKWLPTSTDMTDVVLRNVVRRREQFVSVLNSSTCAGISGTKWGVLQAAIEVCDHYTSSRTSDTEIGRILVRGDANKAKAAQLVAKL